MFVQVISSSTDTAPNNSQREERTLFTGDVLERHHLDSYLAVRLGVELAEVCLSGRQSRARLFLTDAPFEPTYAREPLLKSALRVGVAAICRGVRRSRRQINPPAFVAADGS